MKKLNLKDVSQYVEQNIGTFHQKRIQSLDGLKLTQVLKRKNPYLFKAKYVLTAEQIIRGIVDAHISSNEETIFGYALSLSTQLEVALAKTFPIGLTETKHIQQMFCI